MSQLRRRHCRKAATQANRVPTKIYFSGTRSAKEVSVIGASGILLVAEVVKTFETLGETKLLTSSATRLNADQQLNSAKYQFF